MQVVRGAWAMLTKNVGSVRVDFAQPFSLQVLYINRRILFSFSTLIEWALEGLPLWFGIGYRRLTSELSCNKRKVWEGLHASCSVCLIH